MSMPDLPPLSPRDVWGAQLEAALQELVDLIQTVETAGLVPDLDHPGFFKNGE